MKVEIFKGKDGVITISIDGKSQSFDKENIQSLIWVLERATKLKDFHITLDF